MLWDNKCQGGTGFYTEELGKEKTVLWDSSSKLKEEKKWKKEKLF
jgi:hypothetical protein